MTTQESILRDYETRIARAEAQNKILLAVLKQTETVLGENLVWIEALEAVADQLKKRECSIADCAALDKSTAAIAKARGQE